MSRHVAPKVVADPATAAKSRQIKKRMCMNKQPPRKSTSQPCSQCQQLAAARAQPVRVILEIPPAIVSGLLAMLTRLQPPR